MDKETIKLLVEETIKTQGWGIIEKEINDMITSTESYLVIADPRDQVNIAKLQEKIITLKKTLQIVHNMVI